MTQPIPTPPPRRRGAAYVLVLSTGVLLSVIGLGVLTASRGTTRAAETTSDLTEAAMLAESGVHWGIAALKADSNWRTTYTHNVETTPVTYGRGTMAFKLVDEVDGNLSNNSSDAVRLYGVGRCGAAVRLYSVEITGSGPALEILQKPAHAGGNLTIASSLTATGGALSSNGTLKVNSTATVTGDVEGVTLDVAGSVTGSRTTIETRAMPAATVFDLYKSQATTIPFTSIPSGIIQKTVLSSTSNPYGSLNASGIYYIKVPSTGTLSIRTSRIKAALIVDVESGGKFNTTSSFAWEPPRSDLPSLLVNGQGSCTVTFGHSPTALSESGQATNFNPPGTPDASGVADTDLTDSYPSQFRGLIHVMGTGFTTSVTNYFNLLGTMIIEGNASTGPGVKLNGDPTIAQSPPSGYSNASQMRVSPGTWRWDSGM